MAGERKGSERAEGERRGRRQGESDWREFISATVGRRGVMVRVVEQFISKAMAATKNSRVEFLVRTPAASELKEVRSPATPTRMPATDPQISATDRVPRLDAST